MYMLVKHNVHVCAAGGKNNMQGTNNDST